jgi:hypothetical protein
LPRCGAPHPSSEREGSPSCDGNAASLQLLWSPLWGESGASRPASRERSAVRGSTQPRVTPRGELHPAGAGGGLHRRGVGSAAAGHRVRAMRREPPGHRVLPQGQRGHRVQRVPQVQGVQRHPAQPQGAAGVRLQLHQPRQRPHRGMQPVRPLPPPHPTDAPRNLSMRSTELPNCGRRRADTWVGGGLTARRRATSSSPGCSRAASRWWSSVPSQPCTAGCTAPRR